jgi:glycosyltransferase involved in cell wall biosynthesis
MIPSKEISIITPISNMAGKLERLKDWVSEGLDRGFDVILIHDVKDNQTEKELVQFVASKCSSNLRLFSGRFGGPGLARNQGLKYLRTNWLCFFDADDYPNLENIENQMKTITKETDMVVGQYEVLDFRQNAKIIKCSNTGNLIELMINPGLWRIVFNGNFVNQNSFPDLRMGEDQLYLANLDLINSRIMYSPSIFYQYYTNQKIQLTRSRKALDDLRHSTKILKIMMKSSNNLEELYILYIRQCVAGMIHGGYVTKLICFGRLSSITFLKNPRLVLKSLNRIKYGR